jgi:hypothetical protein
MYINPQRRALSPLLIMDFDTVSNELIIKDILVSITNRISEISSQPKAINWRNLSLLSAFSPFHFPEVHCNLHSFPYFRVQELNFDEFHGCL